MKRTILLLVAVLLAVLGGIPGAAQGQSGEDDSPVLRLLRYIPDTPENRGLVSYGDPAAWYESWGVPRVEGQEDLPDLDPDTRARLLFIMPDQTTPPDVLGMQYVMSEDQRSFYGFDLFNVDRFIFTGNPPETLTVLQFDFEPDDIAALLTASGYESQSLEPSGALFSLNDDYEMDLSSNGPSVGRLGGLNRIAVLDGDVLVGRATAILTDALAAHVGNSPSLADDPAFRAAVRALDDPALDDTGALVGLIFVEGEQFGDPASILGQAATAETMQALEEQLAANAQGTLPPYILTAFATRHAAGASYLALAVVFTPGVDAAAAADVLAARVQSYVSLRTRAPLDAYWTFDRAFGVETADLPVAVLVMRVDDPPPLEAGASLSRVSVFSWPKLIYTRDLGFMIVSGPEE